MIRQEEDAVAQRKLKKVVDSKDSKNTCNFNMESSKECMNEQSPLVRKFKELKEDTQGDEEEEEEEEDILSRIKRICKYAVKQEIDAVSSPSQQIMGLLEEASMEINEKGKNQNSLQFSGLLDQNAEEILLTIHSMLKIAKTRVDLGYNNHEANRITRKAIEAVFLAFVHFKQNEDKMRLAQKEMREADRRSDKC